MHAPRTLTSASDGLTLVACLAGYVLLHLAAVKARRGADVLAAAGDRLGEQANRIARAVAVQP
ncbi:MAG TPA: hypothetical protein VFP72_16365 [Kineosporiaceae bacterium]|nr:hypothetical protein [Kineosporiaceae bacterium]